MTASGVALHGRLARLAWMLEGIGSAVPSERLARMAARHREAGIGALDGLTYAGAHWLGTFVAYVTTRRGLEARAMAVT